MEPRSGRPTERRPVPRPRPTLWARPNCCSRPGRRRRGQPATRSSAQYLGSPMRSPSLGGAILGSRKYWPNRAVGCVRNMTYSLGANQRRVGPGHPSVSLSRRSARGAGAVVWLAVSASLRLSRPDLRIGSATTADRMVAQSTAFHARSCLREVSSTRSSANPRRSGSGSSRLLGIHRPSPRDG